MRTVKSWAYAPSSRGPQTSCNSPPNTWSQPPVPCSSSSEVLHFGTSEGFLTVLNNLATTSETSVCGNGT